MSNESARRHQRGSRSLRTRQKTPVGQVVVQDFTLHTGVTTAGSPTDSAPRARMGHGDTETQRIIRVFSVSLSLCGQIPLRLAGHLDFHHGLLGKRQRVSAGTMNKTAKRDPQSDSNGMRGEYEFDYSRAKPNRFAAHMDRPVVAAVFDSDIASVFNSSAKVNAQLRSIISRRTSRKRSSRVRSHRRKTG